MGVTTLAVCAVYYRFSWHMRDGGDFPYLEALATFLLTIGGVVSYTLPIAFSTHRRCILQSIQCRPFMGIVLPVEQLARLTKCACAFGQVGMEMWARYAHKALWHDFAPGWALHKSHHVPRTGPFEDNDIFAVANAIPAFALCLYGFLQPTLVGGLCFGAGLGITLFGIMYMFIHDGLVHRRFPVGPIAQVPYLRRVAVAHKLHHSEKYGGVPYGMFLGPMELEAIGAKEELDRMCAE